MIDELAYAGPEHLDAAFVAGFDRKQGYPDPAEDLDALAAQGLDAKSAVVDLGTGTGQFALAAARRFGHVTAVDVSPAMLALLRERAAGAGWQPGLRAAGFSATSSGRRRRRVHPQRCTSCPTSGRAAWTDRAMGPAAGLRDLIYDFRPDETEEVFQNWFRHAAADPAEGYTSEDYAEHIRTEHSTFRWLLEPMLAATGFETVAAEFQGRLYGAYTCVKR